MKLIHVCTFLALGGCVATTPQVDDNANLRIGELESKLARMEKILCRVETNTAPKQVRTLNPISATNDFTNVVDEKIDAFIKEHIGVRFGDSIENFHEQDDGIYELSDNNRYLPVVKTYKYLDKAIGEFEDGKLYKVSFVVDFDKKYSEASTDKQINQILADMARSFGLSSNVFQRTTTMRFPSFNRYAVTRHPSRIRASEAVMDNESRSSYTLSQYVSYRSHKSARINQTEQLADKYRRLGAVIANNKLRQKLSTEKREREIAAARAVGETLPDYSAEAGQTIRDAREQVVEDVKAQAAFEALFKYAGRSYNRYNEITGFDKSYAGDLKIPEAIEGKRVTAIGDDAFVGCDRLTSVTIPTNVTWIGARAFRDLDSLTSVTIPTNVTYIGKSAFFSCKGLTSLTLPEGLRSIDDFAFAECDGLMDVTIPSNVRDVGKWAFSECDNLTTVTIPSRLTNIVTRVFEGCDKLKAVNVVNDGKVVETISFPDLLKQEEVRKQEALAKGTNIVAGKLQGCDFLVNPQFKKDAKIYLCLFSASWCGPCRAEMPRIAKMYADTIKTNSNIELIHFSRDSDDEKAKAWAKECDVKFPVVKPKGGNPLNLSTRGIPHLFIVSADGTILEEGHPASIFTEEKLRTLMHDLKTGKPMRSISLKERDVQREKAEAREAEERKRQEEAKEATAETEARENGVHKSDSLLGWRRFSARRAERLKREAKRAEQRRQLLMIQEELRKVREENERQKAVKK